MPGDSARTATLDQLPDGVFQVLQGGWAVPEGQRTPKCHLRILDPGGEERDGEPARHVVAGANPQDDGRTVLLRPVGQPALVNGLEVAAGVDGDPAGGGQPVRDRHAGRVAGPRRHCGAEVAVDRVDDGLDVDAGRDVVDEPDQGGEREQRQEHGPRDREVRDEGALLHRAHGAQDHERVGEGAEEDAKHDLVAGVAGEVAQQPRAHLPGGQRQGRDGDGEGRAGYPDG